MDVTKYLLDVQPSLAQILTSTVGSNVTRYIPCLAQQQPNDEWLYFTQDGPGTVRGIYDDGLNLVESRTPDPYGVLIDGEVTQSPFYYTGMPFDANGLSYHNARYFDPALGVWVSLDPLETANRYGYVSGNPVNAVDPSGMQENRPNSSEVCYEGPCGLYPIGSLQRGECLKEYAEKNIASGATIIPGAPCGGYEIYSAAWYACKEASAIHSPQQSSDDHNCGHNLEAVFLGPFSKKQHLIQSIGIVAAITIPVPVLPFLGGSIGVSAFLMFEGNFEDLKNARVNLDNCHAYFSLEEGTAIGFDLGEGAYLGVVWSTANANNFSGGSANISTDYFSPDRFHDFRNYNQGVNFNWSVSRTLGTCDYSAFLAPSSRGPESSKPTVSFTFASTVKLFSCRDVVDIIGLSWEEIRSTMTNNIPW